MQCLSILSALFFVDLAIASVPPDWRDLIDDEVYHYTIGKAKTNETGQFEGDIAGLDATVFGGGDDNKPHESNAMQDSSMKWKNGVIPYTIRKGDFSKLKTSTLVEVFGLKKDDQEKSIIKKALADIMAKTCLKFVPAHTERDRIRFMNGNDGCYSYIGRVTGTQEIHLEKGCITLIGEVQHEVMHALGFYHEQTRWDRDDYVTIYMENVDPTQTGNFKKYNGRTFSLPYDYKSIMHYSFDAFSADRKNPTILPKSKKAAIGNRKVMSDTDVQKINILYGCTKTGCPIDNVPCGSSCYNPTYHTCVDGKVLVCGSGQLPCGSQCYDTQTQLCNGKRISTCSGGTMPCGNTQCHDPKSTVCNGGNVVQCRTGQMPCGDFCHDVRSQSCIRGRVSCKRGTVPCGGQCCRRNGRQKR